MSRVEKMEEELIVLEKEEVLKTQLPTFVLEEAEEELTKLFYFRRWRRDRWCSRSRC